MSQLIKVIIPSALTQFTSEQSEITLAAASVEQAVEGLVQKFPRLKQNILADDGSVRKFVNIYVNHDDIRSLQQTATELKEGDVVSIIPSIAGG